MKTERNSRADVAPLKKGRRMRGLCGISISVVFSAWCIVFFSPFRFGSSSSEGNPDLYNALQLEKDFYGDRVEKIQFCQVRPLQSYLLIFDGNNTKKCKSPQFRSLRKSKSDQVKMILQGALVNDTSSFTKRIYPHQEPNLQKHPSRTRQIIPELVNLTLSNNENDTSGNISEVIYRFEPGTTKLYNYASFSKGAKVLAHNKEAKGAINILGENKDMYLRNPCSANEKFVVIELPEETLVDTIEMANLEHYSSNFREFILQGSLTYPTENWELLGSFHAENVKHAQRFKLPMPKWTRYMRLNLINHYGNGFYCTLTYIEVYGVDAIERMLEDLMVVNSSKIEWKNEKSEVNSGHKSSKLGELNGVTNEVKQISVRRMPSDAILKILMQKERDLELKVRDYELKVRDYELKVRDYELKVRDFEMKVRYLELEVRDLELEVRDLELKGRDLELNFKKSEEYTKELILENQKAIEEKDQELREIKNWQSSLAKEMEVFVRESAIDRSRMDRIENVQETMQNKEFLILTLSCFFIIIAFFKLVSDKEMFKSGWSFLLIGNCITVLIIMHSG